MRYYNLKCEIPGGLGRDTVFNKIEIPWKIDSLHVVFEGWLGAEILCVSSEILVSESLYNKLSFEYSGIVEYKFFHLEVSENMKVLQGNVELPTFRWMKLGNNGFYDDFAIVKYKEFYNQLIISDRARTILDTVNLGNYSIQLADINENL